MKEKKNKKQTRKIKQSLMKFSNSCLIFVRYIKRYRENTLYNTEKTKIKMTKINITLFIIATIILTMTSLVQASIIIDKTDYELGEQVIFFVTANDADKLEIIHPERIFRLVGNANGEHRFYPENHGEYTIQIITSNNEIKETQTFHVNEESATILNEYFATNKKEYKTGEQVIIELKQELDIIRAIIKHETTEFSYMGKPEFPLIFYPDKTGTYTIILEDENRNKYETTFETKIITSYLEHRTFGSTKPVRIINSKGEIQDTKIKYEEITNLTRGYAIKEIEERTLEKNKKYNIEINTQNEARISIKGFNYKENTNINLDEIRNIRIDNQNSKIISARFEFEYEEITIKQIAQGTQLLKCEEWNYEEQTCQSEWNKIQELKPGEEYEITITNETTNTYAETGIASINTKKSIYKPGEIAELIVVVLDKDGYLVPNAEVEINVTTPENQTHTYSTKNDTVTGGEKGIYYANHTTETEGRYELSVSAKARNTEHSMKSYFITKENYEFDIIRNTQATIDPYEGPFQTSIKITSLNTAETFSFTEILPASFKVEDWGSAIKSNDEENIYLTWHNIQNRTEVTYTYNSPFIIPYLWAIGPSKVIYDEEGETKTFTEARAWYLAIDPITYYDPTSTITGGWTAGTGTTHTEISKGTRQPNIPSTATYLANPRGSTGTAEFGLSSITETGVEKITLWVFSETGGNAQYTFSLRRGGVTLCSNNIRAGASSMWRNCEWTPTGDLSSLTIHLSTVDRDGGGGATNAIVYAAYIDVDTGTPLPIVVLNAPANNSIIENTPVNLNFTATDETYNTLTCQLYTNITGTWTITTTLNNVQTNTLTNTQINPSDGTYIWNVECENADLKKAFAENNRTIYVNVNKPLIENEAINETIIRQNRTVKFNATITDSYGISTATITIKYPDNEIRNHTLQNLGDEYYYEITDTISGGIYNITRITANDTLGQTNYKDTNLWFEVQIIPPTAFNLISPENNTESRELNPTFTWEETTTPDFKNYTLILDKDPIFASPDYIYSTNTITNTSYTANFALDANSIYYWKVIAYDMFENSVESTNSFKYINDRTNPTVTLNNPVNNYYIANEEVIFSYTPNDANTISYCELLTNETGTMEVRQTNNTITKNQPNYFTRTLPEGPTNWNVRCHDEATNQGSGTQRTITIDTTGPVINLISPDNYALIDDTNLITFTANAYDELSSVNYCELIINGTIQETNTNIIDNVNFNFTTFLINDYYEWKVKCYDDLGNDATSTTRFLTVESLDNDPPTITLIQPTQNKYINTSTVFFEYLVEDATGIESCSIYIDEEFKEENMNIINFENNNFTITSLSETKHNWSITCTDNSTENNIGYSNTRYFTIDLTNPTVTLNSPINNSFLTYNNINFVYTPTDINLDYCALYTNQTGTFDAVANQTNPITNETNNFNINMPSGIYLWNIKCHDYSGRESFAEQNYTLSIDTQAPKYSNIQITPATPHTYTENQEYTFNITWTDNFEVETVIFEHNFSGTKTNTTVEGTNNKYNFTILNLDSGIYTYKWYANDTSNNKNETTTYTYTINKAEPEINLYLNSEQNNITINENNYVNIQGEINKPENGYLELYVNQELINSGNGNISNNTLFEIPGTYNVTLKYNETKNYVNAQKTYFITVNDITPPTIILISPANNTLLSSGPRNLIYTANDSSNISNCTLYMNDEINQTNYEIEKNTNQVFTIDVAEETYTWRIQCIDEYENEGVSEIRTFTAVSDETININMTTEPTYEQGEYAIIKVNTTDAFSNPLQTQITQHIIKGETQTPWWDLNWQKRKALQINETTGIPQTNALAGINITGLNGNIASCNNELRIIRHENANKYVIPYRTYYTDNSNWCYIVFYMNLSANEENIEYYAYYNNNNAQNPNYNVDVTTTTILNAQQAAGDEGTPTNVANIIGKNDATFATLSQGGGGGTHSAHGRAFITQTHGPIQKVEISYRYEVTAASGTWTLRYSVNDGTDYIAANSGTTTQTKITSPRYDITSIYSTLTWTELNRTRLQGRIVKTGGGSMTMNMFWVEMNVTHYKSPEITQTNNNEEEELIDTQTMNTNANGYEELTWNSKDMELGTYSSVITASADTYNDAVSYTTFDVIPDATPPNVTLINPEDWTERGKGLTDFSYYVFDYNLNYCTLYIGEENGTLNPIITDENPENNATNTFNDIFTDIGIHEWNVRCHDDENNSAFAQENFHLNISAPDLVVRSEDIWFEYEEKIEGAQYIIYANITNEGLSPAEGDFNVTFYLGDPNQTGTLIGRSTMNNLGSLETKTANITNNFIIGANNIYVVVDEENAINETDTENNKANNTISLELYQYFYGNMTTDIALAKSDFSMFLGYPNLTGLKGHIFFTDADAEFSFNNLQAITRNTNGDLVAGDFANLDEAMNTTHLADSIKNVWGAGTETPIATRTFNISTGQIANVPIVQSTEHPDFVTGILWDTNDDTGNQRYDANDRETVVFVTEINYGKQGRYGIYDFEIRIPATLREYSGENTKVAFYFEIN
jgi:hypothetical protein